jgi:ribosomal protein L34
MASTKSSNVSPLVYSFSGRIMNVDGAAEGSCSVSALLVDLIEADEVLEAIKRTYQPSWLKRKRRHGFLIRKQNAEHVLKDRQSKGRYRLTMA